MIKLLNDFIFDAGDLVNRIPKSSRMSLEENHLLVGDVLLLLHNMWIEGYEQGTYDEKHKGLKCLK